MRAQALADWTERVTDGLATARIWQALESSSVFDRFGVGLYNTIQRRTPWAHHAYFPFLEWASLHRKRLRAGPAARFEAVLRAFEPEVIVSVHAHLNHAYFRAARKILGDAVPCFTYCGELHGGYGFSRHWVNPACDGFIAAVPACADAARKHGMSADKISTGGFLLDPSFFDREHKEASKKELQMRLFGHAPEGPVVLLGTGANGANRHCRILSSLASTTSGMTVIPLCGRCFKTRRRLEKIRGNFGGLSVIPLGYRRDMADLLRAADLAFIRPGTGSTSECLRMGCPVVFNGLGGVMPQEAITLKFMRSAGLPAKVARTTREAAQSITDHFRRTPSSSELSDRMRAINAGLRPTQIVRRILA